MKPCFLEQNSLLVFCNMSPTAQKLSLNIIYKTEKFWFLNIWLQRITCISQLVTLMKKVRFVSRDVMKRSLLQNSKILFHVARNWSWKRLLKPENRVPLNNFVAQVKLSISPTSYWIARNWKRFLYLIMLLIKTSFTFQNWVFNFSGIPLEIDY